MPRFQSEFVLPYSRETVFEFHSVTSNLTDMIPGDAGVELLRGPERLAQGSEFEVMVALLGMTQRLSFRIAEMTSPGLIVNVQLKGPFKSWRETNRFEEVAAGTRLAYDVDFETPGGLLGMLATPDRVRQYLDSGFQHRREMTLAALARQQGK